MYVQDQTAQLVQYSDQLSLLYPVDLPSFRAPVFFVGLAQIGPSISWVANRDQNSLLPMTSSGCFLFILIFLTLSPLHTNFLHSATCNWHFWPPHFFDFDFEPFRFTFVLSSAFVSAVCSAHKKFHSPLSFTDSSLPIWGFCSCGYISATSALELCSKIALCGLFKEITGEPATKCILSGFGGLCERSQWRG